MTLTYIVLGIYYLALIFIGIRDHKTEDKDGFIIADRKVGLIGTLASTSSSLRNGGALFLWVGFGFASGYKLYSIFIGFLIGFFLFSLIAPRARKIAKQKNYITMPQMVKDMIGIKTEKLTSFIALCFSVLNVAVQLFVLGKILSTITDINAFNSTILTAIVVSVYVSLGGYKSIIKTDILQFFIMLGIWIFVIAMPPKASDVFNISTIYSTISTTELICSMLVAILLVFSYSEFWQRIFSSKDDKTAKHGVGLAGVCMILFTIPLTFIGMSAIGIIPENTLSNDVFSTLLQSGAYNAPLIALMTVVGVSICMSTLDTHAYIFSSTLLENFFKKHVAHSKKKYVSLSKIIMVTMLLVSAVISTQIQDVVKYMLNMVSIVMVLSPLFLAVGAGWIKHPNKKLDTYFMWSLIIVFIVGSYIFIQGYMDTFAMRLIPVALSSVLLYGSYLIVKIKKH